MRSTVRGLPIVAASRPSSTTSPSSSSRRTMFDTVCARSPVASASATRVVTPATRIASSTTRRL
jgi:hypothetical protein